MEVLLGPLSSRHLAAFFGDVLHRGVEDVAPLAWLVEEKTGGNPFFAIQFLTALQEERLIEVNATSVAWQWDIEKIRAKGLTDNVVDPMAGKLKRLDPACQAAVRELACLGIGARWPCWRWCWADPRRRARRSVGAVRAGMLLRLGEGQRSSTTGWRAAYCWSRWRRARRPPAHRAAAGGKAVAQAVEDRIFEVTNQLNRGAALITDSRRAACGWPAWTTWPGARPRAASPTPRRALFLQATAGACRRTPGRAAEDAFPLYLELAECEYLTGDFRRADQLFDLILKRVHSDAERAGSRRCGCACTRWPAATTTRWPPPWRRWPASPRPAPVRRRDRRRSPSSRARSPRTSAGGASPIWSTPPW